MTPEPSAAPWWAPYLTAIVVAIIPSATSLWQGWRTRKHASALRAQSHGEHGDTAKKVEEIRRIVQNGNGRDHD